MRPLLSGAMWVLLGGLVIAAQQRIDQPVLSVSTELVTLPVTVVDRQGTLVAGLRREHFRVYENGRPQEIQFFSSEDLPATVGLVIDSSASMRLYRNEVTSAGDAFVATSHPDGEFFTVNFTERVWFGLGEDRVFTRDRAELRGALAAAPARGMTALYDAIEAALHRLTLGTHVRRALIVVSDGGDNASGNTLGVILDAARRTSAVIYGVALVDPDNRDANPGVMRRLAEETGGRLFRPKRPREVTEAFVAIAAEIRSAYLIGYTPDDTKSADYRTIRVTVDAGDGRRLTARTRSGYYASPSRRTVP